MSGFDRDLLARRFGRAASRYAQLAVLQREVELRLLEGVAHLQSAPAVVLDVGAGPGRAAGLLARRYRSSRVIALDLALPMLRLARRQGRWLRPLPVLCADAVALPIAEGSVDLLFSSLCLQWLDRPALQAALNEFRRVLRPGGLMLLASFGPETLNELRQAWAAADPGGAHVSEFAPMAVLGDALIAQGFRDPVLDRDRFTLSYAKVDELVAELRGIGAGNARRDRSRGLTGRAAWQHMRSAYDGLRDPDGRYPATYEVVYAQAWGPQPGQPRRDGGAEIATVPVTSIRRLRRGDPVE